MAPPFAILSAGPACAATAIRYPIPWDDWQCFSELCPMGTACPVVVANMCCGWWFVAFWNCSCLCMLHQHFCTLSPGWLITLFGTLSHGNCVYLAVSTMRIGLWSFVGGSGGWRILRYFFVFFVLHLLVSFLSSFFYRLFIPYVSGGCESGGVRWVERMLPCVMRLIWGSGARKGDLWFLVWKSGLCFCGCAFLYSVFVVLQCSVFVWLLFLCLSRYMVFFVQGFLLKSSFYSYFLFVFFSFMFNFSSLSITYQGIEKGIIRQ